MKGRCVPLRIRDVLDIVKRRPARSRVGSCPHQQADPLQIAVLAELAQCHVRLFLQRSREVRSIPATIQDEPNVVFAFNW